MTNKVQNKNAVIESASIRIERGFLLDCWLMLDYGGSCQGFGGWALYLAKSASNHELMSLAGHHIYRLMEIAGVESWADMPGKTIRVAIENDNIVAVGHIIKENWYCPEDEFKAGGDV